MHLDTLLLHRLRLGEIDGDALLRAQSHLDACAACAGRLRVQQSERAAFVARPVPPEIRSLARDRRSSGAGFLAGFRGLFAAFALAAAVAVGVRAVRAEEAAEPAADTRARGAAPSIEVWVRGDRGPRALRDGEVLGSGDRVQLKYDPRGHSAIALAGRDDSGVIEVYTTNAPTGVGVVTAPFALTLDAAPGPQELYVLGADRDLDEGTVRRAIREGVPGVDVARARVAKR